MGVIFVIPQRYGCVLTIMGVRTGNSSYGLPKKRSVPFPTLHPYSKLTFKKGLPIPNSEYAKMGHPNL